MEDGDPPCSHYSSCMLSGEMLQHHHDHQQYLHRHISLPPTQMFPKFPTDRLCSHKWSNRDCTDPATYLKEPPKPDTMHEAQAVKKMGDEKQEVCPALARGLSGEGVSWQRPVATLRLGEGAEVLSTWSLWA